MQIDGTIEEVVDCGNFEDRFKSFGFDTYSIDGHNLEEIRNTKFSASDRIVNGFVAIALHLNPKIQDMEMDVRGRDLITGLPKTITVKSSEMMEALEEPAMMIIDAVHSVLEKTPPELAADISDKGIYMTGGGCLIDGLDKLLQEKTGINVMIAEDAVSCVAMGTGKALNHIELLETGNTIKVASNEPSVQGYYKSTDHLFYQDYDGTTFSNPITGNTNVLYIGQNTNKN